MPLRLQTGQPQHHNPCTALISDAIYGHTRAEREGCTHNAQHTCTSNRGLLRGQMASSGGEGRTSISRSSRALHTAGVRSFAPASGPAASAVSSSTACHAAEDGPSGPVRVRQ